MDGPPDEFGWVLGDYGLEAAAEIKRVAADVAEKSGPGPRAGAERIDRTRLATERALATTEAAVSTKRITLRVSVREVPVC